MKNRLSVFDRLSTFKDKFDAGLERFHKTLVGKLIKFFVFCFHMSRLIEAILNHFSG